MISVFQWKLKDGASFDEGKSSNLIAKLMLGNSTIAESIWNEEVDGLEFDLVAKVDTTNKEKAFLATNSIDDHWVNATIEDGVDVSPEYAEGCRSTSVGDIFQDEMNRVFMVSTVGFKFMPEAAPKLEKTNNPRR